LDLPLQVLNFAGPPPTKTSSAVIELDRPWKRICFVRVESLLIEPRSEDSSRVGGTPRAELEAAPDPPREEWVGRKEWKLWELALLSDMAEPIGVA